MDKATISKQLAEARRDFSRGMDGVVWEANVGRKIKHAVKSKPAVWIGGAAALGFVLSQFRGRRKPKVAESPAAYAIQKYAPPKYPWYVALPLGLGKMLFPVIQPILFEYIGRVLPGRGKKAERRV